MNDGADRHNGRPQEDSLLATKPLTYGKGNDRPNEASEIVYSSDSRQDFSSRWPNEIVEFEKVVIDNDTACSRSDGVGQDAETLSY